MPAWLDQALLAVDPSWSCLFKETRQAYFRELAAGLEADFAAGRLRPAARDVFRALALPLPSVRAVVLGQDPYAAPGQSTGRAFAVAETAPAPASLRNIFKEVSACFGRAPQSRTLAGWERQGVLLLNAHLTVRVGEIGSHRGRGWERFTDRVIERIDELDQPAVFLLWGNDARRKAALIRRHPILEAAHPSPLSAARGFFGCRCFQKANQLLAAAGAAPIDWTA